MRAMRWHSWYWVSSGSVNFLADIVVQGAHLMLFVHLADVCFGNRKLRGGWVVNIDLHSGVLHSFDQYQAPAGELNHWWDWIPWPAIVGMEMIEDVGEYLWIGNVRLHTSLYAKQYCELPLNTVIGTMCSNILSLVSATGGGS